MYFVQYHNIYIYIYIYVYIYCDIEQNTVPS